MTLKIRKTIHYNDRLMRKLQWVGSLY